MLSHLHILALGFLPGITSAAHRALVESGEPFGAIVGAPGDDLAALGLKRAAIEGMRSIDLQVERAAGQIERAEAFGARIIHFWEEGYPALLREIYAPPVVLYMRGELAEEDARAIAIVGTRRASLYGRLASERYAERFAAAGVTVVSGLARGIDTFAHAATLSAGGRTVAVVASGLDEIQPAYAAGLAARIVAGGAVITEYPFGVKALRPYFPQRNRIISGLAAGTVIVESDERGGAMITAGFAVDQNRDLFAVPGPISAEGSRGTNLLIRTDRARLTQTPDDVLDALGYHIPSPSPDRGTSREELSFFEQRVYDLLHDEPLHVDAICEATGMSSSDALVNLLGLEFKGLVRQMAGKRFLKAKG